MGDTYRVYSIADIARIPVEALPRFVEELPEILNAVRPVLALIDQAREAGSKQTDESVFKTVNWIDDDLRTIDGHVTVKVGDEIMIDCKTKGKF